MFRKPRTVPFAIMEDLNQALEAGVQKGIWIPTKFNDWGTPIVPIRKKRTGSKVKLRVCGDYAVAVNPQLETHRHQMPLPEDLIRKLSGSKFFTKIDLADAYNQMRLAPESQRRLALSTPRGVFLQSRLPFGISSAPGYFQEIMDKLTSDLPGVVVYLDDILIGGTTEEEHLQNLKITLQKLQDNGLKCNKEKCSFAKESLDYLGHLLSREGIGPGGRLDAVASMSRPVNISELKSFLG